MASSGSFPVAAAPASCSLTASMADRSASVQPALGAAAVGVVSKGSGVVEGGGVAEGAGVSGAATFNRDTHTHKLHNIYMYLHISKGWVKLTVGRPAVLKMRDTSWRTALGMASRISRLLRAISAASLACYSIMI